MKGGAGERRDRATVPMGAAGPRASMKGGAGERRDGPAPSPCPAVRVDASMKGGAGERRDSFRILVYVTWGDVASRELSL